MDQTNHKSIDKKSRMAGIDLITSLLVMAVSIAVSVMSLKMPRPAGWKSAPGLIPLLFASTLFFMGLGLFISASRSNGIPTLLGMLSGFSMVNFLADARIKRALWIILLTGIYILLLTGQLPFEIAGGLFLFSAFSVFWRSGGWLKISLISLIIPLFFGFAFRVLFSFLLPGDSIFDLFL